MTVLLQRLILPPALLLFGSMLGTNVILGKTASKHPGTPNFLLILADDHAWMDYGFMGNERVNTPHLDNLAAHSATFVNGYVPSSVCRPSLATILTGLYPHQHGIHFNHGPPGNAGFNQMNSVEEYVKTRNKEFDLIKRLATLPKILSEEKGYRCLQTGKFWEGHYRNAGFTDGMTTFSTPDPNQSYGGIRTLANGEKVAHGNGDYGLKIGRETLAPIKEFIQECEKETTPWLVWYAPYLPHLPHDAPEEFQRLAASRPGVLPWEQPYFASISQFDSTVGNLVELIHQESKLNNTVIVFLSDNGWRPNQVRSKSRPGEYNQTKRSKRAPFDDGLRTPILIRWDGVLPSQVRTGLTSSIDIFPTLLSAADVDDKVIRGSPGIDLISLLRANKRIPVHREIFGEIYPGDATSLNNPQRDIAYRWVRKGRMKLIIPHPENKNEVIHSNTANQNKNADHEIQAWNSYVNRESLFDLSLDQHEQINLAESPQHQSIRKELHQAVNRWWNPSK